MTTTATTPRDWAAIGIEWVPMDVEKRMGDHPTDDTVIGQVQRPLVIASKINTLIEHFGHDRVGAWLRHSSSLQVRTRAWYKGQYAKDATATRRMPAEVQREAIYKAVLMGVTTRGHVVRTVTRIVIGPYTRIVNAGDVVEYATLFGDAFTALERAWPNADVQMLRNFVATSLETAGFTPDVDETDEAETTE